MGAEFLLSHATHGWPCHATALAKHSFCLVKRAALTGRALERPSQGHRWSRGTTSRKGLVGMLLQEGYIGDRPGRTDTISTDWNLGETFKIYKGLANKCMREWGGSMFEGMVTILILPGVK